MTKYVDEWNLYVSFARKKFGRRVPGRDRAWRMDAVAQYLQWRSRRCNARTLEQVKSKIKHCGICYGYLLPTAKTEGPALQRLQLAMISKAIRKRLARALRAAGKPTGPKRSLALGRVAMGLLFSAYGATTFRGFAALPDAVAGWLTVCAAMGTGCMRFFLVKELWQLGCLRWSGVDSTFRFAADWRKMKEGGPYTVPFPASPQYAAMYYPAYSAGGAVVGSFTAADVLGWRVKQVGSARASRLFSPPGADAPRRSDLQCFMRWSFRSLLTMDRGELEALVEAMTPHGWRAGVAGDMHREGVRPKLIMRTGRWRSKRAMEQYVRDGLAQRLSQPTYRAITSAVLAGAPYGRGTPCERNRLFCAGGSSDCAPESEEEASR